ncbi:MAG: hypothetical protein WA731_18300 [Pseudonocardiaceae bacterium]|jgi:hypothetical protein|nr:hypothetical protein [Pseudonocardiaceae bacterium]
MPTHDPRLDPVDAIELGEIRDWLGGTDNALLAASFRRFVGTDGYELTELRQDLARFTVLLGNDDGGQLFGTDQN